MHNKYVFLDWHGRNFRHTVTSLSSFDSCNDFVLHLKQSLSSIVTPRTHINSPMLPWSGVIHPHFPINFCLSVDFVSSVPVDKL